MTQEHEPSKIIAEDKKLLLGWAGIARKYEMQRTGVWSLVGVFVESA